MLKKIILFFFVFAYLGFSFTSVIFAQGSCLPQGPSPNCKLFWNGCDEGYTPKVFKDFWYQCKCDCVPKGISNPIISGDLGTLSGVQFLNKFISLAISLGFIIAAVVFFFMFITGGIKWITSGGDKNNVEMARNRITHAIIGLLLTFALYVILGLIEDFFGISLRQFNLPKLTD